MLSLCILISAIASKLFFKSIITSLSRSSKIFSFRPLLTLHEAIYVIICAERYVIIYIDRREQKINSRTLKRNLRRDVWLPWVPIQLALCNPLASPTYATTPGLACYKSPSPSFMTELFFLIIGTKIFTLHYTLILCM